MCRFHRKHVVCQFIYEYVLQFEFLFSISFANQIKICEVNDLNTSTLLLPLMHTIEASIKTNQKQRRLHFSYFGLNFVQKGTQFASIFLKRKHFDVTFAIKIDLFHFLGGMYITKLNFEQMIAVLKVVLLLISCVNFIVTDLF